MKSLFLCLLLFSATSWAGILTFSASGTWATLGTSDAYFASNESWSLSFQVANPPPVLDSSSNPLVFFKTSYSNATYTLNGHPVAVTGTAVYFYAVGSFDICLGPNCVFQMNTYLGSPQLWTGSPSNPVLVPGIYALPLNGMAAHDNNAAIGPSPSTTTLSVVSGTASVPEPISGVLTGSALLLAVLRRNLLR